jgi:UDP-glucose 4-epimerase
MKETVLITGNLGFVGHHLMKALEKDYYLRGYDLKDDYDILDYHVLKQKMTGVDYVVHLAAKVSVSESWKNPRLYYENNVIGTSNVVEAAKECGVKRIIAASSCAMYYPFSSPYAASKAMDELILEVNKDLIPSVAFRFFNIYGQGQNPEYGAAIPEFIRGTKIGKITIYGNGEQTRDFVNVRDICGAIKKALQIHKKLPKYVVCDVGSGKSISVNNLAEIIRNISGKKINIERGDPRKEIEFIESHPDILWDVIGYKCKIDLFDGIEDLMANGL